MIKISITGPESSGKSALCEWLAERIPNSVAIPEVARIYLEEKGSGYKYDKSDLLEITAESINAFEKAIKSSAEVVINDNDFYIMYIWWKEVYKEENKFIRKLCSEINFDFYMLCEPDIPWEYDPLRENEHDRYRLYDQYINILELDQRNVILVNGLDELRFEAALENLLQLFPQLKTK